MKNLVLIQARCGSTRLPNKVLAKMCGKTDLEWVIERVSKSSKVDEIIVITSIEKNNLPLIHLCSEIGTRIFVGAEDDVLDRYYQAARLFKPQNVIRITADCPLIDWRYIDNAIELMDDNTDYVWQATESFPDGLDVEVMTFDALKEAWENADLSSEREHVTQYIRKHPELFRIKNQESSIKNIGHKRWTLDEDRDYEFISQIYKYFVEVNKKTDFVTEDILQYLEKNPHLEKINQGIIRNEGLAKSLANDKKIRNYSEPL